jgi:hypothetical protein
VFGVAQLGARSILDVSDSFFGYAILEMGVDSAVADGLLFLDDRLNEGVVGKPSVVCVVVPDRNVMELGKCFVCLLGSDGFFGRDTFLQINERVAAELVNK